MFGRKKKDEEKKEEVAVDKGLMIEEPKKPKTEPEEQIPPLTHREMKALKRSRYEQSAPKWNEVFVIQNKRTKQIAELRAMSAVHAANLIGWRPRQVKLLERKMAEDHSEPVENKEVKREQAPETKSSG
jgi:hypothetical protein